MYSGTTWDKKSSSTYPEGHKIVARLNQVKSTNISSTPYIFDGIAIVIILVISNMIIIIALFILIMNPPHLR